MNLALIFLIAAVIGVIVFRLLKLPPMLGYLAVGVFVGPNTLGVFASSEALDHLAEIGVVFLMFTIGLEFSLVKLKKMRFWVFGLGLAQVGVTIFITLVGGIVIDYFYDFSWQSAVALGGVLAMSSTAIVSKLLIDRLELESEHGKRVMSILLFQDIAVVPMIILIPALNKTGNELAPALGFALIKIIVVLFILLSLGHRLLRVWFGLVAWLKSAELFMLNLLLVCLGMAWLTQAMGLSLALGAFIAGILIAETQYKHQVEADIRPFRDVLLGLFFITVGMVFHWQVVFGQALLVLVLLLIPLVLKSVIIIGLVFVFEGNKSIALRTGLWLTQAGEFSFVLLRLSQEHGLVPQHLFDPILAAMIISMLIMPWFAQYIEPIIHKIDRSAWILQSVAITKIASRAIKAKQHIIICGYGRCGQNLAYLLSGQGVAYVALDLDPERVQQAEKAGHTVMYGNAAVLSNLIAAGLKSARAVVISFADTQHALSIISLVRDHSPLLPIIVRSTDEKDIERLTEAGATEIVPELIEGSLMLATHALSLVGVPLKRVLRQLQKVRDDHYESIRGYFHGDDDSTFDEIDASHLSTVSISNDSHYIGQPLSDLMQVAQSVTIVSLRRYGKFVDLKQSVNLAAGDILVLRGKPENIHHFQEKLEGI